MNLIILKYGILIGALLTTTAFVSGTFNNTSAVQGEQNSSGIDTQSVFSFGSQVFYKEVSQPGNDYMQGSVQGYSQDLVPNDTENQAYASSWQAGVAEFESGYNQCILALSDLSSVPGMKTDQEKMAVCQKFSEGENEMNEAKNDFLSAKGSTSPAVYSGFTIAMALEKVDEIIQSSDDADTACMNAVLADHNNDMEGFIENRKDAQSAVKEMQRVYPELKAISIDFT
jgi:hypothetical protein